MTEKKQLFANSTNINIESNFSNSPNALLELLSPPHYLANTSYINNILLKASCFDTPLGQMIAISSKEKLYLLEFTDRKEIKKEIERLILESQSAIILDKTEPIISIENELNAYFKGTLREFKTPFWLLGTSFQKLAWEELLKIPYGNTRSYLEQAIALGKQKAFRAVANANGANQLAIIIPCHRIINHNGKLGGYGGGIIRKKWLIEHEKKYMNNFSL